MEKNIEQLKSEFQRIRSIGLIESKRNGPTGVGYTFEFMLKKEEDQLPIPDYIGIELKCVLGYSKSDMTLFTCTPHRDGVDALHYIFKNYSYKRSNNSWDYKLFSRKVYARNAYEIHNYSFKLCVDFEKASLLMNCYSDGVFRETVCEWTLEELNNKLVQKLSTLAVVEAYPYKRENKTYYKYLKVTLYKLKNEYNFYDLINKGDIYVLFYLREGFNKLGDPILENHGVAFKIKRSSLWKLFSRIK